MCYQQGCGQSTMPRCAILLRPPITTLRTADIANLLRKALGVSSAVLPTVAFVSNGLTIAWMTAGPRAQVLSYTVSACVCACVCVDSCFESSWVVRPIKRLLNNALLIPLPPSQAIKKVGGPTLPDFSPFRGTSNNYCSLLDINPELDLDSNPADGIIDASTVTLVGRIARPIPGRTGYYICAIAPAGGFVKVKRTSGLSISEPVRYPYTVDMPNVYATCAPGGFLYRLGAINAPGDSATDMCLKCPRGSYATSAASLCIACPPNNYQDRPGQRACKSCQFGYAAYSGAARCMNCYYGRPYCSEGYTPNEDMFTCNSQRLPEGYSPDAGYSIVRPLDDPTEAPAAAKFSPMFKNCNLRGGSASLLALNVSAECKVDMYVLGDLGNGAAGCSQNAERNSIGAFYTAPNLLSSMTTKGNGNWRVGLNAVLDGDGLAARIFATSFGARIPDEFARPTEMKLVLPESGWSYLGGGDNGQGLNANVKGINFDPCPAGGLGMFCNSEMLLLTQLEAVSFITRTCTHVLHPTSTCNLLHHQAPPRRC